ncbi:MAG: LysR family transcriptional regulator [Oscillospiraceae bacterium]|nr:LysR family transcriptional regulator [Oscillospiraceae bacterium]
MDILRFKYFITAAERLNFTVAAKERYITQTAMSLHIKKMEDELGFQLFVRDKRSIRLTEAGRDFYHQAVQLVAKYEMAVKSAESLASGARGMIGVMMPGYGEGFMLLDKLRAFASMYPDVSLNIRVEAPGRHITELKNSMTDLIIGPPSDTERDPEIETQSLREDPIFVVCNSSHPFAKLEKVTANLLREEPAILYDPQELPNTFREMLNDREQLGLDTGVIIPVRNFGEMLMNIGLERGISFLPGFAVERLLPISNSADVVCLPLEHEGKVPTMTTVIGYLKSNTNPILANLVAALLTNEC